MLKKFSAFFIAGILIIVFGLFAVRNFQFSSFVFQLFFNKKIELGKADENINILLLGVAGENHEGPNLTDTIIFASIDSGKNKISLVSIPRDLWVSDLNAKINTAYAKGELKGKGQGLALSKKTISKLLNQRVDYVLLIDFNGFTKAVDLIGGLDLIVDNSFDDYEYPIEGKEADICGHKPEEIDKLATFSSQLEAFPCRYARLHFDKGFQHLDGKTALTFVRSRHAQGEEGTDFARSKRQEKVIKAFEDNIFSAETYLNPAKIFNLFNILKSSIDTDIKPYEYDDFIKLSQKMKNGKTQSAILDYGDKEKKRPGLLVNPVSSENYLYQWVLVPRTGDNSFSEIQEYVNCIIKKGNCDISEKP